MDLRADVKSRWRDQHLSKAAWLQSRWQEVSERERRAQLHNRKLLQDFQRAQDTLTDLVARTEAMNTIRVEYERYLEENFPRWQQKLKDKRLSEQRKRIEEHLKACILQMEEDQRINGGNKSPIRTDSPSSISPLTSHPIPHTSERKDTRREVHVRKTRSTLSKHDNKQDLQGDIQNISQPLYIPFTWLTHPQPSVTEPQRSNISKQTKTFQNIHQALNSSLPLPGDPLYGPVPVVQQEQPSNGHLKQHPKAWAGGVQCAPAGFPWTGLPVNPLVWKMLGMSDADAKGLQYSEKAEGEKRRKDSSSSQVEHKVQRQRREMKSSDQSSELDTKSVHLSNSHRDSSDGSALSSEAVNILTSGMQRMRKKRRGETQTHQSSGEKEGVSQGSSSLSDSHSDTNNKKDKISQSSPVRKASFKTGKGSKAKVKNTAGTESPKQLKEESEQEGNSINGRLTGSSIAVERRKKKREITKKDEPEEKHHKDQEERVSEGGEGCLSEDGESKGADARDKEQDEEVGSEGLYGKRNGRGASDEQEADRGMNDKAFRRNASEGGFVLVEEVERKGEGEVGNEGVEEEEDGGEEDEQEEEDGEEEEKDGGIEEEDDEKEGENEGDIEEDGEEEEGAEEISVEVKAARRGSKGGDESDDEGNDSEVAASDSRRNVHDSLKELYKDEETEDEELYDQEIEDDIEDDDDDVVVEKAYPWSRGPAYSHTKYQDDDDDDVEGLLAPQNKVQQHQSDEEKEILKPNDSQSDSEEDGLRRKPLLAPVKDELAGSDDEFDHFYD